MHAIQNMNNEKYSYTNELRWKRNILSLVVYNIEKLQATDLSVGEGQR